MDENDDVVRYANRDCPYTEMNRGDGTVIRVPHPPPLVRGEKVGDVAFIDGDDFRQWDGEQRGEFAFPF